MVRHDGIQLAQLVRLRHSFALRHLSFLQVSWVVLQPIHAEALHRGERTFSEQSLRAGESHPNLLGQLRFRHVLGVQPTPLPVQRQIAHGHGPSTSSRFAVVTSCPEPHSTSLERDCLPFPPVAGKLRQSGRPHHFLTQAWQNRAHTGRNFPPGA